MSEPKLISPLLDGFVMGDPISDHHGVRSCPAMQVDTDNKYIIKILSVPASQTKLDALLLAGAFPDADAAAPYFQDLADGIVQEAMILQRLSQLEGFTPYESWQVVPMEDGETGFDVYLRGAYRPSLERSFRRKAMTHLQAVNLGLDLCAALAVCRRSGYLYINLKPDNVFLSDDQEYRIGDLGFVPLDSLQYASMPERYLSRYTPPEITDAYSALNETMDVYSAGLILYQAYNGGTLPFAESAGTEPLSAPAYADPEMAQIILKACDPNPEVRWQDPLQMGQALAAYLQSHSVNDTPIVVPEEPILPEELMDEPADEEETEPSTDEILAEVDEALVSVGVPAENLDEQPEEEVQPAEETETPEETDDVEETEEITEDNETSVEDIPETTEDTEDVVEEAPEEVSDAEESASERDYVVKAVSIEESMGVTKETSRILAHAEDLIAHETPDPVVVPDPIDVPIPEPIEEQEEESPEEAITEEETFEDTPAEDTAEEITEEENTEEVQIPENTEEITDEDLVEDAEPAPKKKKKLRGWVAALIALVLVAGLSFGGYLFYENYYVQTILGITLSGSEDKLTVTLNTDVADELLSVQCIDTYGNTLKAPVENSKANFTGLSPSTRYKVQVLISGLHKLVGKTTQTYETADQTSIIDLKAVTGAENGSVILSFTVQGPEAGGWKVTYVAEDIPEQTVEFSGHMVTLTGLTIGKEYTFRLQPQTELYVVGTDTLTYTASNIVYAENLQILGFLNGALNVKWDAPEGSTVPQWSVRCYNNSGFDKTVTTEEASVSIEGMDINGAYTLEVTADGMTQGTRTYITENSITASAVSVDGTDPNRLTVTWEFEGTTPEGGWLVMYTLNDDAQQYVLRCAGTTAVIEPKIPGSIYHISIQAANGSTVFGGTAEHETPKAEDFSGYLVSKANMTFTMCKTPAKAEWQEYDVPAANRTSTFRTGEKMSFILKLNHEYNTSPDQITSLFVIRDAEGKVVTTGSYTMTWTSMWYRGFSRVNVPVMPETAGDYTIDVYFNGAHAHNQSFKLN